MVGYQWPFEQFVEFLEAISSPLAELNPIIPRMLAAYPDTAVFARGGHAVVLQISPDIAAKVSLKAGEELLQNEQKLFQALDQFDCPHIVQCYFRAVDVTFIQLLAEGALHDRMHKINRPPPILSWMLQLSSAVACLEALGFAHGDLNLQNVLLTEDDQVKLIDFDHSVKIGEPLDVGYEPYIRQYCEPKGGQYGVAGPISEQFALGSIFWYMTRGTQLYSELEGPDVVHRLMDGILPDTDPQDPIDCIISNCWTGHYPKIADLVEDIKSALGDDLQSQEIISLARKDEMSRVCKEYCISTGISF